MFAQVLTLTCPKKRPLTTPIAKPHAHGQKTPEKNAINGKTANSTVHFSSTVQAFGDVEIRFLGFPRSREATAARIHGSGIPRPLALPSLEKDAAEVSAWSCTDANRRDRMALEREPGGCVV